jgi:chromosome segregation ATPase
VERADRHSDDIARNADRVARRASLLKIGDELESELAQLETRLEQTEETLESLSRRWQRLWDSELVTVRPPQEMRRWLEHRKAVLDRQREFEFVQKEGTTLDKQRQDALDGLVEALGRYFPEVDLPFDNLTQTLEFLEKKLSLAKEASGKRASLEQSLTETRYELDEARAKQRQVDQRLDVWRDGRPIYIERDQFIGGDPLLEARWSRLGRPRAGAHGILRRVLLPDGDGTGH